MQNINLKQNGICRICGCTETLCSHCSIEEIKNDKATDRYSEELI